MSEITVEKLVQDIEKFLTFKRALGHPYRRGELMLRSFERFVQKQSHRRSKVVLEAMVGGWLSRIDGRKPVTVTIELGVLRQLCLYLRRSDPHSFVPGREWAPQPAKSVFLPYVFSREEVRRILDAAEAHHGRNISAIVLRTFILILYCTGLRLGEAVRLQLRDLDLKRRLFIVRESKGKARLVPFRSDLARELEVYLRERETIAQSPSGGALLVRLSGDALPPKVA